MNSRKRTGFHMWTGLCLLLLAGCVRFSTQQGVDNKWRDEACPAFTAGATTRAEVMDALGPPSQILTLEDGTAFYYLREFGRKDGLILLLYNDGTTRMDYDRAVFFFDENGILTELSYSSEEAPR